ncbi:MAG TPA: hypothetical protein VF974_08125 [Patescibacteria group bacterium]
MNRSKIINAILEEFRKHNPRNQEHVLVDALKHIVSDTGLLAFAIELGIDTDRVLEIPRNVKMEVVS